MIYIQCVNDSILCIQRQQHHAFSPFSAQFQFQQRKGVSGGVNSGLVTERFTGDAFTKLNRGHQLRHLRLTDAREGAQVASSSGAAMLPGPSCSIRSRGRSAAAMSVVLNPERALSSIRRSTAAFMRAQFNFVNANGQVHAAI